MGFIRRTLYRHEFLQENDDNLCHLRSECDKTDGMKVCLIVTSAIKSAGYIDNKSLMFLVENKYPIENLMGRLNYYSIITRHYITKNGLVI